MPRTIITDDLIIKMNELYLQIKTYAGVSRALGGSPSPSTVKKYIIPNYTPKKSLKSSTISWDIVPSFNDINLKYNDFGDLCELSPTENVEIKELWEELSIWATFI